jgi:hypothetical protein
MTKTQVEVITSVQRRRRWSRAEKDGSLRRRWSQLSEVAREAGMRTIARYSGGGNSFASGRRCPSRSRAIR